MALNIDYGLQGLGLKTRDPLHATVFPPFVAKSAANSRRFAQGLTLWAHGVGLKRVAFLDDSLIPFALLFITHK